VFDVIPAIDLRDGRCVRLLGGDFGRETIFSSSPLDVAREWERVGATRLHIVDLDGARGGAPAQLGLVAKLVAAVHIPLQFGGGLRSLASVKAALECGVERVVLGTAAIGSAQGGAARAFRLECLRRYPERIVISLDARNGKLAIKGWIEDTALNAFCFARQLRDEGFQRIVYTDIRRDGALSGPNVDHIQRLTQIAGLSVVASGGMSSIGDLIAVREVGAEAAIVGQALYTGQISLPDAKAQLCAEPRRSPEPC